MPRLGSKREGYWLRGCVKVSWSMYFSWRSCAHHPCVFRFVSTLFFWRHQGNKSHGFRPIRARTIWRRRYAFELFSILQVVINWVRLTKLFVWMGQSNQSTTLLLCWRMIIYTGMKWHCMMPILTRKHKQVSLVIRPNKTITQAMLCRKAGVSFVFQTLGKIEGGSCTSCFQ